MKFTKMQGCGNDYVYVNCFEETVDQPKELAKRVSDRRFGIGSDGLILIRPSDVADFMMEMYNVDGTQGEMCGNAIRCVGKYVYDHGMTRKMEISIETLGGIKSLLLTVKDGAVTEVTVDMGIPELDAKRIPVVACDLSVGQNSGFLPPLYCKKAQSTPGYHPVIDEPIFVAGKEYRMTAVSMGNPHAVIFVKNTMEFSVKEVGPFFEYHKRFPERINTEFVQVLDRNSVNMRVWERGSGETWACGTGACASAMSCILNGYTEDEVTVHMLGGDLKIRYDRETGHIFMTGPAVTVFEGELYC